MPAKPIPVAHCLNPNMSETQITNCVSEFPELHNNKLASHQDMIKIYSFLHHKISTCICRCQVCLKNPQTEESTASSVGIVASGRRLKNRESRLINTVTNKTKHALKDFFFTYNVNTRLIVLMHNSLWCWIQMISVVFALLEEWAHSCCHSVSHINTNMSPTCPETSSELFPLRKKNNQK